MRLTSVTLAAMLLASPAALAQTTAPERTTSVTADGQFYSHQAGEMRASKLIVTNAANETVGEISDVVLGKDGKVAVVIIGVGGFLGMGEREVAVSFGGLKIARDSNNRDVISVNATKDQLKAAPAWKWENTSTAPRQ